MWIIEDVIKRVENVSNEKTGTGRIREVQLIPQFYFSSGKHGKRPSAFHDPNQNFRFPFLKTETPALYPKRPAARN